MDSGVTAVVPGAKFTAPTSGLEDVISTRGTTRDAVRLRDTLDKLAHNVGTWHVYGAANVAKAMKDMAEPVFMRPVRPPRRYYKVRTEHQILDREPMVETSNRFTDGQFNIKLVENAEWKLDLDLFMII